ncbi:universal stress protein (plasmid) [Pseudorhodobacter turbinis]|uniref:Universal stress protein n=1 Tax=Pseudorhodobacter turbinis TaxID=2500533 RepID=A0A4P8EKR4_9RHOB|nr:universal stress protein [Pseudorhodobacter turbinis]QCO57513.1 universal stress protein [Pseudorhodobacter turbinis]
MGTILVATDFSERSDQAMERAALIAARKGARLHVVHVVDDDQKQRLIDSEVAASQELLQEDAQRLRTTHSNLTCTTDVVMGDPFEGIGKAADSVTPSLVVLGAHRRHLLRDVFVGTTAQRTIRRTRRPVLMVNVPPTRSYGNVLLSTDFSDASRAAARTLAKLDLTEPQNVTLLHVYETLAEQMMFRSALTKQQMERHQDELKQEADRALAAFLATLSPTGFKMMTSPYETNVSASILEVAREQAADLIVAVSQGRNDLKKTLLGSVAEEILRRADRDVLIIPPAKKD